VTIWCQSWLRTYTRENHAKNGYTADVGTPAERIRAEREAAEKRADDRFKAWREKMATMREELVAETEATREETSYASMDGSNPSRNESDQSKDGHHARKNGRQPH
jgi:hypothetical protein